MGPNRSEWQKRCTFNGFCKKVLMNFEAVTARYVDVGLERKKEVLDAYHDAAGKTEPPKAEKAEPKKAKGKAKKKAAI